MAFPAQYPGTCPECGERWAEGDVIRGESAPFTRGVIYRHDVCPDAPNPLAPDHPPCPVCFLTHPEGKCDQ